MTIKKHRFRTTHFMHGFFLIIFVLSLFKETKSFLFFYEMMGFKEFSLNSIWWTINNNSSYRPVLFLMFPIIGMLIKNRIGWILITTYLYFVFINVFVQATNEFKTNYFFYSIIGVIILTSIIIMNKSKDIHDYYKLFKNNFLSLNLYSFITGIGLSLILIIIKHYNMNILQDFL